MNPPKIPDRRYRWALLSFLLAASFLHYFDRQTVSILKTTLKAVYHIREPQYALLVNMFTGFYAVAYILSGWLVDRIGPRKALTLFAGLWSAVTLGCGLARTFTHMLILRAMLGVAEPGFQPVSVRVGAVWAPSQNRGLFLSLCGAGSIIGAIAAPPIVAAISLRWGWRFAFIAPGLLGFSLAGLWWFFYREPSSSLPPAYPAARPAADLRSKLTWPQMWRKPALWGLILGRFLTDPIWYYGLFWLPGYLQETKGASLAALGRLAWLPFLTGNLGGIALTALSDRLAGRGADRLRSRKRLIYCLAPLGALFLFVPSASLYGTVGLFCAIMILSCGWMYSLPAIIADSFPVDNVASVWGIVGALGAASTVLFNYLVGRGTGTPGYPSLFVAMAALYPTAAVMVGLLVRRIPQPLTQENFVPLAAAKDNP